MELKNALAAWKKAKPILTTKSGVSEALRTIGPDPSNIKDFKKDLPVLEKCKKVIDAAATNKQIMASKTGLDCIRQIQVALTVQINKHSALRRDINEKLKDIFSGGHDMVKKPSRSIAEGIKSDVKAYDALFEKFTPANAELAQVPTRVALLASNWAASLGKPGVENIQKEMTNYMKAHPIMAV